MACICMKIVIKIYHVVQELNRFTNCYKRADLHSDYSAYPRVVPLKGIKELV